MEYQGDLLGVFQRWMRILFWGFIVIGVCGQSDFKWSNHAGFGVQSVLGCQISFEVQIIFEGT